MTIEQAFELVANLDFKKSHRRIAPQHGLLHFNRCGEVVSVDRFKMVPNEEEKHAALVKHPGCLQISTMPDWFANAAKLRKRIDEDLWLFSHIKHRNSQ